MIFLEKNINKNHQEKITFCNTDNSVQSDDPNYGPGSKDICRNIPKKGSCLIDVGDNGDLTWDFQLYMDDPTLLLQEIEQCMQTPSTTTEPRE